ncbi:MAG: MtrB/PioB family outer membrane beta-barrel protein, partial [Gammaproteobacteria bacterium]
MRVKFIPGLILTSVCLIGASHAAEEDSIDFSLDAAPEVVLPPQKDAKPAFANEVELGGLYGTEESFKFGEYSGLQNRGGYLNGNLSLQYRAPYAGAATDYWKLDGRNLGLESRYMRGEYGKQGKARVFFEFNQTPHYRWDDARTPFIQ